jgi:hypothetical protein
MESRKLKIAIANAIIERLWIKGLLTDTEKDKIISKNESSFL